MPVSNIADNTIFYRYGLFTDKGLLPNLVKFGKKWKNSISFLKFMMAAAAMLDSSHQAFFIA